MQISRVKKFEPVRALLVLRLLIRYKPAHYFILRCTIYKPAPVPPPLKRAGELRSERLPFSPTDYKESLAAFSGDVQEQRPSVRCCYYMVPW